MYEASEVFDLLLDRLMDMGAPAATWERKNGRHEIWLKVSLPGQKVVERGAETLELAAQAILDNELSAPEKDREQAVEWFS